MRGRTSVESPRVVDEVKAFESAELKDEKEGLLGEPTESALLLAGLWTRVRLFPFEEVNSPHRLARTP